MTDLLQDQEVLLTKKGTVRKRKPKKSNNYFTEDTQKAILEYRACQNQERRNEIYNERIHEAFYKLAENIIHTFKFYYTDTESESIEDLKFEVISFLMQKIDLYNESRGKAYSYFGTITKRYLIAYNQKNYKNKVSKVEVKDVDNDNSTINSLISDEFNPELNVETVVASFVKEANDTLFETFHSSEEIRVAIAILEIFENVDSIDIFNKKAIYVYVKEMVNAQTNTITKVIKKLKIIYKRVLERHIKILD
jgi:hypothetical protein